MSFLMNTLTLFVDSVFVGSVFMEDMEMVLLGNRKLDHNQHIPETSIFLSPLMTFCLRLQESDC